MCSGETLARFQDICLKFVPFSHCEIISDRYEKKAGLYLQAKHTCAADVWTDKVLSGGFQAFLTSTGCSVSKASCIHQQIHHGWNDWQKDQIEQTSFAHILNPRVIQKVGCDHKL